MKKILLPLTLSILLSACVAAPKVDFTGIDKDCAQQCSVNHTECLRGFTIFPLAKESACKAGMETCAKACPREAAAIGTADRLKEIDALLAEKLITPEEHAAKRQEILKAM